MGRVQRDVLKVFVGSPGDLQPERNRRASGTPADRLKTGRQRQRPSQGARGRRRGCALTPLPWRSVRRQRRPVRPPLAPGRSGELFAPRVSVYRLWDRTPFGSPAVSFRDPLWEILSLRPMGFAPPPRGGFAFSWTPGTIYTLPEYGASVKFLAGEKNSAFLKRADLWRIRSWLLGKAMTQRALEQR